MSRTEKYLKGKTGEVYHSAMRTVIAGLRGTAREVAQRVSTALKDGKIGMRTLTEEIRVTVFPRPQDEYEKLKEFVDHVITEAKNYFDQAQKEGSQILDGESNLVKQQRESDSPTESEDDSHSTSTYPEET